MHLLMDAVLVFWVDWYDDKASNLWLKGKWKTHLPSGMPIGERGLKVSVMRKREKLCANVLTPLKLREKRDVSIPKPESLAERS